MFASYDEELLQVLSILVRDYVFAADINSDGVAGCYEYTTNPETFEICKTGAGLELS